MKLGVKKAPAPAEEPADTTPTEEPSETGDDDLNFGLDSDDQSQTDDTNTDTDTDAEDTDAEDSSNDKPFDDEPFDAGVDADEEEDPKKFIQQLTGKLGQSLRKYTEEQGEPDFKLEKFAINSLLSATHTAEMDAEDQKDIIKKVKSAGKDDDNAEPSDDTDDEDSEESSDDMNDNEDSEESTDDSENMFETEMIDEMSLNDWRAKAILNFYENGDDTLKTGDDTIKSLLTRFISYSNKINDKIFIKDLGESDIDDMEYVFDKMKELGFEIPEPETDLPSLMEDDKFLLKNPKKNNMFQEGSNDILDEYEIYNTLDESKKKDKKDACYHKVKARYDVWPSAYSSGALVKCRKVGAANWGNKSDESVDMEALKEKWSKKYKDSIDCNNPKGFSQKAHCQSKKKNG